MLCPCASTKPASNTLNSTYYTMKVFIHYEDNTDNELWKTLKITLPKSWKTGPTSKLLAQFIETYNGNATLGASNPLSESDMHLSTRKKQSDGTTKLQDLASDDIVLDSLPDRADVYVCHGASQTKQELMPSKTTATDSGSTATKTVNCKRFGCQKRFPPGEPTGPCCHHKAPPVFHETAKFWSCCPNKKAYDWDDFQAIPGCCESDMCTEFKEEDDDQRQFLGGTDLREKAASAVALKSIDDFNKEQTDGPGASTLERLRNVLEELDVDKELFDQVVEGMKKQQSSKLNDAELMAAVQTELSKVIKSALKEVAAAQLRIK